MSLLSPNRECIYAYDAHHQQREDGIQEDVSDRKSRERERERERDVRFNERYSKALLE